ncbi:MAG: preprotein translocase subunit SecE [Ancrocorticia sp.]|nr:preprotein translocase subunit SecE [Ancrocorticia sp.]
MNEAAADKKRTATATKRGFFARIALFFSQVFAELKKVQRPTRQELGQLFVTVIVFIAAVMLFVGAFDFLFSKGTFWIFG